MKFAKPYYAIPFTLFSFISVADDAAMDTEEDMEHLVITTTREAKPTEHLSESVGVLTKQMLEDISPSHPADALNRIAGVHINNLGGEGHMSAIRQPITTAGVYLFLEDGVPTRPSGFFNHNGLYEINIPQSSRVEVIKGPGSALYGSDAIGGVINVITPSSPDELLLSTNLELGSDGWKRGLFSFGNTISADSAFRLDFNMTDSDGFREQSDYQRESLNARFDHSFNDQWNVTVTAAHSTIEQSGASSLEYQDYQENPEKNRYHSDIGYREVDASRLTAEISYQPSDQHLFTLTPFYRDNQMKMMPSWMVTYDPNVRDYEFQSYGALAKYRYGFTNGEVIVGFDIDSTPSTYMEDKIEVSQNGDIYVDYNILSERNYYFDADQKSWSPYIHSEYQVNEKLRVNAGVRYDKFEVDYKNLLVNGGFDFSHLRPASQKLEYSNTSAKLGATYQLATKHNLYLSYREAFRAPTVGALFRPGSSANSTELNPVTSSSKEIGIRGAFGSRFSYDLAVYDMKVSDDIVSIIDDGTSKTANAGKTQHKGVELGFDVMLTDEWQLGYSYTYTDQTYLDFNYVFFSRNCFCNQQINFAGNQVSKAPKTLSNARIAYLPDFLPEFRAELEWQSMGKYYTDQTNTGIYDGHDLVNLRASYALNDGFSVYARIANLADKTYSTYTSNQVNDPDLSYRPGMPRSLFVGVRWSL